MRTKSHARQASRRRAPTERCPRREPTRDAELLRLQRLAGNGAVRRLLVSDTPTAAPAAEIARRGAADRVLRAVAPVAKPAPTGAAEIKQIEPVAGGVTTMTPGDIPSFEPDKPVQADDSSWTVTAKPTSATPPTFESFYPGAGLHDLGARNAADCKLYLNVTPGAADRIKAGEQEHIEDYLEAYRLSYATAANIVAGLGTASGKAPAEAKDNLRARLRTQLPSKLRSADPNDPGGNWQRTFGLLCGATYDRDRAGWHTLRRALVLDPAEKKKLNLPQDGCSEATEYVETDGKIGETSSAVQVKQKYDSLPDN